MKWMITPLTEKQVMLIDTEGIMDETSFYTLIKEGLDSAHQFGYTLCLVDHAKADGRLPSVFQMYNSASRISGIESHKHVRIAYVVPEALFEEFKFFETACVNRGLRVATFLERTSAIDWLVRGEHVRNSRHPIQV